MDRGLLRDAGDEISPSYDKNFLFGWTINDCATIAHVQVSYKMPPGVKPFSEADKRAAIELWKAAVPLQRIREQLGMSERGLCNILAYAKKHPEDPVKKKSKDAMQLNKVSLGPL